MFQGPASREEHTWEIRVPVLATVEDNGYKILPTRCGALRGGDVVTTRASGDAVATNPLVSYDAMLFFGSLYLEL